MSSQVDFSRFAGLYHDWHRYQIIRLGLGEDPVIACWNFHNGGSFIHVVSIFGNEFPQLAIHGADAIASVRIKKGIIADLVPFRGRVDPQPARTHRCIG